MTAPKFSLFGPEAGAAVPGPPAPPQPRTEAEPAGRLLVFAMADACAGLQELALLLNAERTDHTMTRLRGVLASFERAHHRVRWFMDGTMPPLADEVEA